MRLPDREETPNSSFLGVPFVAVRVGILALWCAAAVALSACGSVDIDVDTQETDVDTQETDRAALAAFYNAMGGDNWTNNTNWLSEAPLGEWHGVGTNSSGRVFNVRLTDNGLIGELPSELGSLTYLIVLGAKDNQVRGDIPVELGNLAYLATIELHDNQLTGGIPSELGSLPRLLSLRLEGNQLSGEIPPELGRLSVPESLDLNGNSLSGDIPQALGLLSNLATPSKCFCHSAEPHAWNR